jgi:hypothetical protein
MTDLFNLGLEKGIRFTPAAYLSKSDGLATIILSIISYRRLHWLPIAMLAIWAFSPLGSQATLRFISIRPSLGTSIPVQYLYPDATTEMEEADAGILTNVPQTLLLSSMISVSSTGSKPQDTWGNIKIPFYESLNASTKDEQGFVSVPTENVEYTSLIGIPVSLPAGNLNLTFTIQSWYWTFQNSNLTSPLPNIEPSVHSGALLTNLTGYPVWLSKSGQTFQLATASNDSYTLPMLLWFQDSNPVALILRDGVTNLSTTVTQTFVESQVSCNLATCAVTAMREVTPLRNTTHHNVRNFAMYMIADFVNAILIAHPGTSDEQGILESFLGSQANSNPFGGDYSTAGQHGLTLYTVGTDQLSQRLNILINTYWIGFNALSATVGAFNTSYEYLASLSLTENLMNTTATVYVDNFHCNRAWLSVLIISTLIMIISSLISVIVNCVRVGTSDFTDFVWVLTHGSFNTQDLPSYLDTHGILKERPSTIVQLGDASPSQGSGKVVITELGESFGKVTKDRVFV